MDNSTVSTKKSSINYGLILGGILGGLSAVIYATNIKLFTQWWLGIILFLVALTIGIISVAKSKSLLDGFISFKKAFTAYFITIAIGLFITTIVNILIFNVVDPDAAEYLNEQIIEVTQSTMERFGAPEETINQAISDMEGTNNYSVGKQLQGFIFQLLFYSVFGLLIALIMKKKDPNQVA